MEIYEAEQLWTDYQNALGQMEKKVSALYGIPVFLMGRSTEFFCLGGLVVTLLIVVGVQW
jgi:hypothetical protein